MEEINKYIAKTTTKVLLLEAALDAGVRWTEEWRKKKKAKRLRVEKCTPDFVAAIGDRRRRHSPLSVLTSIFILIWRVTIHRVYVILSNTVNDRKEYQQNPKGIMVKKKNRTMLENQKRKKTNKRKKKRKRFWKENKKKMAEGKRHKARRHL